MAGAMGVVTGLFMTVLGMILIGRAGTEVVGVGAMTLGLVLVIVGAIIALLSFLLWSTASGTSTRRERRRRALIHR